jgi:hypothetical protein
VPSERIRVNVNVPLRRSIAVAAVVLAPVLSSCGFDAPTDRVYTPAVGVNERSGSVDVLNAVVVSGADGSGTLVATLVNNDTTESETLQDVAGNGVTVRLDGPVDVERGASVSLIDETEISLDGEEVKPGNFIELTFRFEQAEAVTVEMPVVARRGTYAEIPVPTVAPTPHSSDSESSSH